MAGAKVDEAARGEPTDQGIEELHASSGSPAVPVRGHPDTLTTLGLSQGGRASPAFIKKVPGNGGRVGR